MVKNDYISWLYIVDFRMLRLLIYLFIIIKFLDVSNSYELINMREHKTEHRYEWKHSQMFAEYFIGLFEIVS